MLMAALRSRRCRGFFRGGLRSYRPAHADPGRHRRPVDAAHAALTDVFDYFNEATGRSDANELVVDLLLGWADTTCSPPTMAPERVEELTDTLAVLLLDPISESTARR